jgi:hypothetical protein
VCETLALSAEISARRAAERAMKHPMALRVAPEAGLECGARLADSALDERYEPHELQTCAVFDEWQADILVKAMTQGALGYPRPTGNGRPGKGRVFMSLLERSAADDVVRVSSLERSQENINSAILRRRRVVRLGERSELVGQTRELAGSKVRAPARREGASFEDALCELGS